jgi:hypothetical protein
VNQSFAALGRILGPFVGSYVFFLHDSRVLPFAVATAVLLGVVMLLPMVRARGFTAEGAEDAEKRQG